MINLRNGKIIKLNHCCICKEKKEVQAHHENYDNPLEILWLCTECHNELHKIKRSYYEKDVNVSFAITTRDNERVEDNV